MLKSKNNIYKKIILFYNIYINFSYLKEALKNLEENNHKESTLHLT